jgi:hypothetical protein
MGLFAGPYARCCDGIDIVIVSTRRRYLAVCIACERVFADYVTDRGVWERRQLLTSLHPNHATRGPCANLVSRALLSCWGSDVDVEIADRTALLFASLATAGATA